MEGEGETERVRDEMRWDVTGLIHRRMIVGEFCCWGQPLDLHPYNAHAAVLQDLWLHSWNPFSPCVSASLRVDLDPGLHGAIYRFLCCYNSSLHIAHLRICLSTHSYYQLLLNTAFLLHPSSHLRFSCVYHNLNDVHTNILLLLYTNIPYEHLFVWLPFQWKNYFCIVTKSAIPRHLLLLVWSIQVWIPKRKDTKLLYTLTLHITQLKVLWRWSICVDFLLQKQS